MSILARATMQFPECLSPITILKSQKCGDPVDGSEIRRENQLECKKSPVHKGMTYQPQLVSEPSTVHLPNH